MAKGLHLRDFALADELRLMHVLSNFAKAESALEFVSVFDLLALKQASSARESLSFLITQKLKRKKPLVLSLHVALQCEYNFRRTADQHLNCTRALVTANTFLMCF